MIEAEEVVEVKVEVKVGLGVGVEEEVKVEDVGSDGGDGVARGGRGSVRGVGGGCWVWEETKRRPGDRRGRTPTGRRTKDPKGAGSR